MPTTYEPTQTPETSGEIYMGAESPAILPQTQETVELPQATQTEQQLGAQAVAAAQQSELTSNNLS